jgi:hypothetical protein
MKDVYIGSTGWLAQESPPLLVPSPANIFSKIVLGQASSSQEVVEMLAMRANSSLLLPSNLQKGHQLSRSTFAKLFPRTKILSTSPSATNGANSSFSHCQG